MSPLHEIRKSKNLSRIDAAILNREREAAILLGEAEGLKNFRKRLWILPN